jgi:LmbE family N-acetylglucosaminyl deacetylase
VKPSPGPFNESFPERALIPYETSTFEAGSVLVLAPHPDDEVFGCGAALASLLTRGARVTVLVLTDGAANEAAPEERRRISEVRLGESRSALAALGGGSVVSAGFEDRRLRACLAAVEQEVAARLVALAPDLVFVPSPVEIHPDHRALADAFLAVARRPASDPSVRALQRAKVAFYEVSQPIRPNFLLDASPYVKRKEKAMAAFASQNAGRDYPDFVSGMMVYRRMTLPRSVAAAEAFFVVAGAALGAGQEALVRSLGPEMPPA